MLVGLDLGTGEQHAVVLDSGGKRLHAGPLPTANRSYGRCRARTASVALNAGIAETHAPRRGADTVCRAGRQPERSCSSKVNRSPPRLDEHPLPRSSALPDGAATSTPCSATAPTASTRNQVQPLRLDSRTATSSRGLGRG
ncbi:hypothetical protein DMP23_29625 [Amycolatopsis sp. A1MSW2902]